MFRVLEWDGEGAPRESIGAELVARPPAGTLRWVDVVAHDEAELRLLAQHFGFHPLAIEDCAHADQRPKAEEYDDHLFVVTQGFECPGADLSQLRWHELHTFLGVDFLVTVHSSEIPGLEQVRKRVASEPALLTRGIDFIYYLIADRMVDDNFPILDVIADELEELEDAVLTNPQRSSLGRVFSLKQQLVQMRKVLSPQRDVMSMLAKRGDSRISEKTSLYFRDVYDHLARMVESIEANRDLLGNALDAYLSSTGLRTNEIMKALAIMSAVFMPLTFITGFFGQNFEHLPFGSDVLMWSSLASLVVAPIGLLWWFKSRQWF